MLTVMIVITQQIVQYQRLNGIRGFNANNVFVGNQRLTLNMKPISMRSIFWISIRMDLFCRFCIVEPIGQDLFSYNCSSYGIGLRFRNDTCCFFILYRYNLPGIQMLTSWRPPSLCRQNPEFYRLQSI